MLLGIIIYLFICIAIATLGEMVSPNTFWLLILISVFGTPLLGLISLLILVATHADSPFRK